MYYGWTQLHIDCMDIFSYFNSQIIVAMVKCVKASLERLKMAANLAKYDFFYLKWYSQYPIIFNFSSLQRFPQDNHNIGTDPMITTEMHLTIPTCTMVPSIEMIQEKSVLVSKGGQIFVCAYRSKFFYV